MCVEENARAVCGWTQFEVSFEGDNLNVVASVSEPTDNDIDSRGRSMPFLIPNCMRARLVLGSGQGTDGSKLVRAPSSKQATTFPRLAAPDPESIHLLFVLQCVIHDR